jgi:hypothetical protein
LFAILFDRSIHRSCSTGGDAANPDSYDPADDNETDEHGDPPTCADPDGDGVDHSALDPDSNEGGLISSVVHGVDQALPSPIGGDQGAVTEVNCALIVTVEEILGVNG